MIKVASIISSLSTRAGGPIINLVESVPHLRQVGVEVTIFATDMGAPAAGKAWRARAVDFPPGVDQCDIRVFRAEPPRRIAYAPSLRMALRSELCRFDLVRIHGLYLYPQYAAASETRRSGLPYIVTPHGALDPWLRQRGRMRKALTGAAWQDRMLRQASAVHATTRAESDLFDDAIPIGPARRVVGNGVAIDVFGNLPARGTLRSRLGVHPEQPVVLFLGRLSRKKAVDLAIRAVAQMIRKDVCLIIVGPDDEKLRPELRKLADDLSISDRTYFVGPLYGDERLQALADADVWILPSHTENFGNAVIEAMAAGVPTIISTEVNLADDIRAAKAGVVVTREPAVIAAAVTRLLADPDQRERLAVAGRRFAARYDWPEIAGQLASMYQEFARPSLDGVTRVV